MSSLCWTISSRRAGFQSLRLDGSRGRYAVRLYCHLNNIAHRDLKLEHILISNGHITLTGFHLCTTFAPHQLFTIPCGTSESYFPPPELLLSQPYDARKCDVWAFGALLYTALCGKVPFDAPAAMELRGKIKRGERSGFPLLLSPGCKALLDKMLDTDPRNRIGMKDIYNSEWMSRGYPSRPELRFPFRSSLQVGDVDPAVIEAIATNGYSTPDHIREQLNRVLMSQQYLSNIRRKGTPPSQSTDVSRMSSEGIVVVVRRWSTMLLRSKQTHIVASGDLKERLEPDWQEGVDPIISMYHLASEKLLRKSRE